MIVGYARTSSLAQVAGLEAQERDLRAAGCDKIFREQVSSVAERQQLEAALDYVREGDSMCVTKIDRLARSVADLLAILARLEAKMVTLRVLSISGNQPLDTATSTGRLMLSVIGAVGQAERKAMLERQREGIAKAKRDGRHKCRVPTARWQSAKTVWEASPQGQRGRRWSQSRAVEKTDGHMQRAGVAGNAQTRDACPPQRRCRCWRRDRPQASMVNEGLCEHVGCEVTGGAGAALIHTMRAAGLTSAMLALI